MKIFVKCCNCGHVVYTERKEILSMISARNFSCSDCNLSLTRASLLICSDDFGKYCDVCEFRFYCFSSEPIEVGLDN